MWKIYEHKKAIKKIKLLPIEIVKRYEKWKDIVRISGPDGLKKIKGFKDEALFGVWSGHRSSRLNIQYHVIYKVENIAILYLRGALYESLKQQDKALVTFEKVIKLNEKFIAVYPNIAGIHMSHNDYAKAIETFKRGLAIAPENVGFLIALANVYEKNADTQSAIKTYQQILQLDQKNTLAANNAAVLIGNTSSDPVQLKYALGLVKNFKAYNAPELLDTYGWLSYLNGDYEEALVALEKANVMVPDYPEFKYHLGMTYAANGRVEDAKLALEKAVSNDANFVGVDKAKAKLVEIKG